MAPDVTQEAVTETPRKGPSNRKGLSLIDCDVHNRPRSWDEVKRHLPAGLRQRGESKPGSPGFANPFGVARRDARPPEGGPAGSSPEMVREQLLDPFGVDYAVLVGPGLRYGTSADYRYAAAACSALNDWLIESWLNADSRFVGSLMIAPQWPEGAAREIRRVGHHRRIIQVVMGSASRMPFGNANYFPIYEAAEEMGLPVAIHAGAEGSGITSAPTSAGWPSSYMEWHTDIPQTYQAQVASLICEGVFEQFPGLKFVCIEGGFTWLAPLMWRLDKEWKSLRQLTPWLTKPPSEYILDHIRLTTQPIAEPPKAEYLQRMFEMIHAERVLMFSSDYPHWDFDSPTHGMPRMDPELADRVYHQNAQDLYGLPDNPAELDNNSWNP